MCNGSTPPARSYTTDELLSYNDGQTCQYIRRDVRKQLFKKRIFSPRYRHATPGLHRTVASLPTVIGDVQITPSVEPVNESRVVSTGSVDSTEVQLPSVSGKATQTKAFPPSVVHDADSSTASALISSKSTSESLSPVPSVSGDVMTTTTLRPSELHDAVSTKSLPPVSPVDAGSTSSTLPVLPVDSKTSTELLPDVHDNTKPMISRKSVSDIKLGVMNCQSICNKLDCITDHAEENGLDIIAMTETWLSNVESRNKFVHDQCCANGYTLHHRPRNSGRKGGGVGVLIKNSIKLCTRQVHVNPAISSFESMEFVITVCSVSIRLVVIYRMPASKVNGLKVSSFCDEFSDYIEKLSCASGHIMIVGDFNINYLDPSGCEYKRFVDILDTFDFVQNIELPTHSSGHLLDYVITRKNSTYASNFMVSDFISDHRVLHVSLTCMRAHPV